ncbi:MAG: chemotaxis protein CheW [Candidatus Ozemobacteraceae bacterium]
MLLLKFHIAGDAYAVAATEVTEIVPYVGLRDCPGTPPELAGIFVYRGNPVPVIDLALIFGKPPAIRNLSTRILLTRIPSEACPSDHVSEGKPEEKSEEKSEQKSEEKSENEIGLLVEDATEVFEAASEKLHDENIFTEQIPGFGRTIVNGSAMIQIVRLRDLIPAELATIKGHIGKDRE